jgi:hypothetical protein
MARPIARDLRVCFRRPNHRYLLCMHQPAFPHLPLCLLLVSDPSYGGGSQALTHRAERAPEDYPHTPQSLTSVGGRKVDDAASATLRPLASPRRSSARASHTMTSMPASVESSSPRPDTKDVPCFPSPWARVTQHSTGSPAVDSETTSAVVRASGAVALSWPVASHVASKAELWRVVDDTAVLAVSPQSMHSGMRAKPLQDGEGTRLNAGDPVYVTEFHFDTQGLPWAQVGGFHGSQDLGIPEAWVPIHNGQRPLLQPDAPPSSLYEAAWAAAESQHSRSQTATQNESPPQPRPDGSSNIDWWSSSPDDYVRKALEASGSTTLQQKVSAGSTVVNLAGLDTAEMASWSPEQIAAFARNLQ